MTLRSDKIEESVGGPTFDLALGEERRRRHGLEDDHLKERRLRLREVGLIQTFPPDYIFTKARTMSSPYKYIGNAVPPLLAYFVADKIEGLLKDYF